MYKVTDQCLRTAEFFYDAVAMMLCACEQHSEDGKQEFVMAAFSHFVSNSMRKMMDKSVQVRLVNLFCQHACVADISVPTSRIMQSLVHYSFHMSCIQLMANYMPIVALQEVGEEVTKKKVLHLLQACNESTVAYGEGLRAVFGEMSARSLQHACKLNILRLLRHRGSLIERLPLPAFLKMYLSSDAF